MPVIADFLGVTIDELFGLAPEKVMSVHERAMIEIYDMSKDNKTQRKRLEYAYDWYEPLLWDAVAVIYSATFLIM